MDNNEIKVFDGKSLADLFQEIHTNSVNKREQIHGLIEDLRPFIKSIGDAAMLVPIIKEYMDVSVKNDEHLIKLAIIVQRIVAAGAKSTESGNDFGISEEEKKQLIREAESYYTKVMDESEKK